MKTLSVFICGLPVAQPRPRAVSFRGHARMYNPGTSNEWKACVIQQIKQHAGAFAKDTPLRCDLTFYMPRPKAHYGAGKNAGKVKASAPTRPTGKPDVDNLFKSTTDAITRAGVWRDDSQLTDCKIRKRYTEERGFTNQMGCSIRITEDVE